MSLHQTVSAEATAPYYLEIQLKLMVRAIQTKNMRWSGNKIK